MSGGHITTGGRLLRDRARDFFLEPLSARKRFCACAVGIVMVTSKVTSAIAGARRKLFTLGAWLDAQVTESISLSLC